MIRVILSFTIIIDVYQMRKAIKVLIHVLYTFAMMMITTTYREEFSLFLYYYYFLFQRVTSSAIFNWAESTNFVFDINIY